MLKLSEVPRKPRTSNCCRQITETGKPLEWCLQGRSSTNSTTNGACWFHFQLCVLAVVWIAWSVPALLICLALQQTLTTPWSTGLVGQWKRWGAGTGGRTGGASGSFWPRLQHRSPKTLPPSPALISDHGPSPDITIPSRIGSLIPYSLDSRLPVLQCAAIPNSISFWRHHPRRTQSAALPIHPFVYRPENSRIHCPGRAATATFPRSHGSRFTPTPSHRRQSTSHPGPPPTTPHTATAAQSCPHVDGLSLTWGQASLCGPESSLSFRLRMTFRLGCIYLLSQYIHEASPNRDSIPIRSRPLPACQFRPVPAPALR